MAGNAFDAPAAATIEHYPGQVDLVPGGVRAGSGVAERGDAVQRRHEDPVPGHDL